MDKLEKAKQAAWEVFQIKFSFTSPVQVYSEGFDAGVAYQGEWTAVEDGLPTKSNDYLVEMESPYSYQTKWYNPELLSNGTPAGWEGDSNIIRWREIPK